MTMAGFDGVAVETVTGTVLRQYLPALGRLRAMVFRDWPYLYDAEPGSESRYHEAYVESPGAGLVLALADGQPVGAATCVPLRDETPGILAPFAAAGLDVNRFFYFGESVLLAPWRGRGIGVEFFRRREAHARAVSNAEHACFCAVERPADHPLRPPNATSLEPFWGRRGYTRRADLTCTMQWRDIGQTVDTPKTLTFWVKPLHAIPLGTAP